MRGTLDYCHNLLNKIQETTDISENVIEKIQIYVDLLKNLQMQFQNIEELFFKLDFTYIENIFEGIEQISIKNDLLPKLEDIPL